MSTHHFKLRKLEYALVIVSLGACHVLDTYFIALYVINDILCQCIPRYISDGIVLHSNGKPKEAIFHFWYSTYHIEVFARVESYNVGMILV